MVNGIALHVVLTTSATVRRAFDATPLAAVEMLGKELCSRVGEAGLGGGGGGANRYIFSCAYRPRHLPRFPVFLSVLFLFILLYEQRRTLASYF